MATIVQPYNPWREQLAVGTLVPIISGILERQRERDENRKINAAIAKSIADAGGAGAVMPPLQSAGAGVPALMQGNNGWENAFHSNASNPLTQFDAAMGMTAPQTAQPQQTQAMPVSANDIMRALFANLGTERFNMLNSEAMQKLIAPYLPIAEQARNEFRQKEIADAVMNAPDAMKRLANVWSGAAQGLMPYGAISQAQGEIKPFETDTGGNIQRGIFDYATGQYRNGDTLAKSLSPEQSANLDMANRRLLEDIRQFNVNDTFRNKQLAQQNAQFEASRQDANRPKYGAPFAVNGKLYQIDQNGETRPFMIGDEHADAPENFAPAEWTEADTQMMKRFDESISGLKAEKQRLRDLQDAEDDPHKKLDYNKQIAEIDNQIDEMNGLAVKYIQSKNTPRGGKSDNSSLDTISSIVGNANAGKFTGHFGDDRGNHKHGGIDLPARAGEPIRVISHMGDDLTVTRISNNPEGGGGYGCFVELQGTKNGKKVKLILAHMGEGSLQVRPGDKVKHGDILGKVGNTGRTSDREKGGTTNWYKGKKSGNHLHLEVWEDGVRVDPRKYFAGNSASPTVMPPSASQAQPQSQTTQTTTPQAAPKPNNTARNASAAWTHSSKQAISNQQYEYMRKQMQEGKIPWAHSQEELDRGLESIGYKRADTALVSPPSVLGWRPQFGSNMPSMPSGNTSSDKPATVESENSDVQEAVKKLNQDDSVGDYFTKWNVLPAGLAGIRGRR